MYGSTRKRRTISEVSVFSGGHVSIHATHCREGCMRKQNSTRLKMQYARQQNCISQHVKERRCAMQAAVNQTRC